VWLAVELDGCSAVATLSTSVSVPVGSAATLVLPMGGGAVAVSEGEWGAASRFVFANGAYVPGVEGVSGAAMRADGKLEITTGGGNYKLFSLGEA
jgi:hypothetical protein